MANPFENFGANTEEKNLGFSMTFDGTELDESRSRSLYRLVTPGEYDFKVYDMEFLQSAKGTDYTKVTLSIQDETGEVRLSDSLFCTQAAKWKIVDFFASIGMWDEIKKNGLDMDGWKSAIDKTGRAKIDTRAYTKRNGEPGETNEVKAYLVPGEKAVR